MSFSAEQISKIAIAKIIAKYPQVIAIYLFGSFAQNNYTKDSDVDLAVLLLKKADAVELWHLAQEISNAVGRDVDLIDLMTATTVFQWEIIHSGKIIYVQDQEQEDRFADKVFKMYIEISEIRRAMVQDIINEE